MPTYEYACQACGHGFEIFQQMSDPVKRKCPKCGKPKLQRLIGTGAGVIFKGGGFYETDYRSESYKKAAAADKKSIEPAAPAKTDGKADSKAASDASTSAQPDSAGGKSDSAAKPARSKATGRKSRK